MLDLRLAVLASMIVAAFSITAAAAETCRTSDIPSITAQARHAEDQAEILGSFPTQAACYAAWENRLRRGETDEGKHLVCVTRQDVLGGSRIELRALDLKAADIVCLRINACLFDRFDLGDSDPANRALGRAWDRLSCDGH